jgi:hypothetical protein
MRFLFAFIKDEKNLVKIAMDDGKERWMETSKAVYGFAKKALKGSEKGGYKGDEVKVTYTEENGKYNCTRIEKIGGSSASKSATTDGKPKCSDCGKELKDDKYKKCYTCNKKNPSPKTTDRTSAVNESIKRQAIGHMTSRSLVALQGTLDPNTIQDIIRTLYKLYTELVG